MRLRVGVAFVLSLVAGGCAGGGADSRDIRQWTDDLAFRISSEPVPPRARERTVYKVIVRDKETGQPLVERKRCDHRHLTERSIPRVLGPFKTSMLQDLEAGKRLEIDGLLAGTLEIARKAGVRAPFTESLFGLIRARAQSTGQYR